MTLLHMIRYFNCGFYYYKYISVELIFKETRLNEISENKFPSKITCYMVCFYIIYSAQILLLHCPNAEYETDLVG